MGSIVDKWNVAYFNNRLSPGVVAALNPLNEAGADAQAVADRAFRLMRVARFDPVDLSALTAWSFGFVVPKVLPSAWGDVIPPVTMVGRHCKLDDYIAANPWHQPTSGPVLIDLGCGFPPSTAVDSAAALIGWRVIGVDPSFNQPYLLYDDRGGYACFSDEEHLSYYQTRLLESDPNPAAMRARYHGLLQRMLPLLADDNTGELAEVEQDGVRLVRNPLRRYESDNLMLTPGEIGSFDIEGGVDVIRCMNVLMFFDQEFRERTLQWASRILRPGGLFICGCNWARSTNSRYTVYQEKHGELVPREFSFSIDNVRPTALCAWYALHDDYLENLCRAEAVGIIRSDESFQSRFDERLDALLAQTGMRRGADGYLDSANVDPFQADLDEISAALVEQLDREGFVDEAVILLRNAGRDAWRNAVGHVAMRPVPPRPLAASALGPG
ncbi:MAG: class I SAM-dependent methyltransferase [Pseudonocardiaceae bacterium]